MLKAYHELYWSKVAAVLTLLRVAVCAVVCPLRSFVVAAAGERGCSNQSLSLLFLSCLDLSDQYYLSFLQFGHLSAVCSNFVFSRSSLIVFDSYWVPPLHISSQRQEPRHAHHSDTRKVLTRHTCLFCSCRTTTTTSTGRPAMVDRRPTLSTPDRTPPTCWVP